MKRFIYIVAISSFAVSCAQEESGDVSSSDATAEMQKAEPTANKRMIMEIDGMTCEMNCGGAITNALKETEGVTDVEIDFEDGRQTNVARVSFDSKMVTPEEMTKAVTDLFEHQYKVGTTSVEDLTAEVEIQEESTSDDELTVVDASTSFIELPNLMDLFSDLLTF